jgi:uncharacterized membrane protein
MKIPGMFPLLLFLVLLGPLPLVFGQLFTSALIKLKLDPTTAVLAVVGILAGSPFNIPVKRIPRTEVVPADPLAVFGLSGWWPSFRRIRRDTVIVGLGGAGTFDGIVLSGIVAAYLA